METKYTREQLMKFSNRELLDKTNGCAVSIYLTDGRWTQLCVDDLLGLDKGNCCLSTKTGVNIKFQDVKFILIGDKEL